VQVVGDVQAELDVGFGREVLHARGAPLQLAGAALEVKAQALDGIRSQTQFTVQNLDELLQVLVGRVQHQPVHPSPRVKLCQHCRKPAI
jgi:hypothetical protein